MTAWPSFDVTISLFSQSVQKYYNNFACARFYFERIGNKCFHRGESRGIDLLPYKEERYISSFWNEKTRVTFPSSLYRGGVTQWRRSWKTPSRQAVYIRNLTPSPYGHSPYIPLRKHPVRPRGTAGERLRCIPLSPLLRFYEPCSTMLRGTAGGRGWYLILLLSLSIFF